MRHLAKSQLDTEPSIRTNTCILLGRLAPTLGPNTKRKVLVPAFSRALKDSFVHARVAGLMALMATVDCYDVEDVASKVIPSMAFTLVDKEKYVGLVTQFARRFICLCDCCRLVRDQAFKAMEVFVGRLETHAATMVSIQNTTRHSAILPNEIISPSPKPLSRPRAILSVGQLRQTAHQLLLRS